MLLQEILNSACAAAAKITIWQALQEHCWAAHDCVAHASVQQKLLHALLIEHTTAAHKGTVQFCRLIQRDKAARFFTVLYQRLLKWQVMQQ